MKTPAPKKVGEEVMSRRDVEQLSRIAREHGERLLRLRDAYLTGDRELEHELVREVVGVPKARAI